MKKNIILLLFICFMITAPTCVSAIDFKIGGLWQFGFGVNENSLVDKQNNAKQNRPVSNDKFKARQRLRLWLTATASDNLSGSVQFEIGHQRWGQASTGAALGADGDIIKLRQAYIDWMIPQTQVKLRMGIQNVTLPNVAGDSNIMANQDVAAVTAAWKAFDNWGLTAMWARPYNDNYTGSDPGYLDNMDLFMLSIPLEFDFLQITPWVMYGMQGKNTFRVPNGRGGYNYLFQGNSGGNLVGSLTGIPFGNVNQPRTINVDYGSLFWAGLPIKLNLEHWNIEFEANYGYAQGMGDYNVEKSWYGIPYATQGASTKREGWLAKALVEYKLDWITPGIFGWYATGDDGNLANGSERIPFIYAETKLTSMLGDAAALYGGIGNNDRSMSFDGTWGIGAQLKDISFIPKLKHLLRAAWVQGTNSPSMIKYADFLSRGVYGPCLAWQGVPNTMDYYLTTRDNLLELNFNNIYDINEGFRVGLEFGYVINMLDQKLWKRAADTSFAKTDMWQIDLKLAWKF